MTPVEYARWHALTYLTKHRSYNVRMLDNDIKLSVALTYEDLRELRLAIAVLMPDGPHYYITRTGRKWLERYNR